MIATTFSLLNVYLHPIRGKLAEVLQRTQEPGLSPLQNLPVAEHFMLLVGEIVFIEPVSVCRREGFSLLSVKVTLGLSQSFSPGPLACSGLPACPCLLSPCLAGPLPVGGQGKQDCVGQCLF